MEKRQRPQLGLSDLPSQLRYMDNSFLIRMKQRRNLTKTKYGLLTKVDLAIVFERKKHFMEHASL